MGTARPLFPLGCRMSIKKSTWQAMANRLEAVLHGPDFTEVIKGHVRHSLIERMAQPCLGSHPTPCCSRTLAYMRLRPVDLGLVFWLTRNTQSARYPEELLNCPRENGGQEPHGVRARGLKPDSGC